MLMNIRSPFIPRKPFKNGLRPEGGYMKRIPRSDRQKSKKKIIFNNIISSILTYLLRYYNSQPPNG